MVALAIFVPFLLFATPGLAAPMGESLRIPHIDPAKILCQLPILKKYLCPRDGQDGLNRQTVFGVAKGTEDPSGAHRFIVKYANSERWKPSTLVSSWSLPYVILRHSLSDQCLLIFRAFYVKSNRSGSPNVTAMPLACPQPFADPSAYTEDCLSMILYVPPALIASSSAPTLMWYVNIYVVVAEPVFMNTGFTVVLLSWDLPALLAWMARNSQSLRTRSLLLFSTVLELYVYWASSPSLFSEPSTCSWVSWHRMAQLT